MNYSISIWGCQKYCTWELRQYHQCLSTKHTQVCPVCYFNISSQAVASIQCWNNGTHNVPTDSPSSVVCSRAKWCNPPPPPNLLPDGFLPGRDVRGVCENWDNMGGSFQPAGRVTVGSDWVRRTSIGVDIEPLWRTGSTWMGVCVSPSQQYFWSYTGNREPFFS